MTPKEIINNVRANNEAGHAHCMSLGMSEATTLQQCSDIDHLLAIHAAVVELFDAERAWDRSTKDEAYAAMVRAEAAKSNLAALCGWTGKDGV